MSKTMPVRWWRDDATRYQSRPPFQEMPEHLELPPLISISAIEFEAIDVLVGFQKQLDDIALIVMGAS